MNADLARIWGRFGISLDVTPTEAAAILNDVEREKTLARIFAEGRARLDGESYIPNEVICAYNRTYGASFEKGDVEIDCDSLQGKVVRMDVQPPKRNRNFER